MVWKRAFGLAGIAYFLHWIFLLVAFLFPVPTAHTYLHLTHTPFDHFLQWDAQWYIAIAKYGYNIPLIAQQPFLAVGNKIPFMFLQASAYFPFLPILIHIFGAIGALLVGNVVFYGSLVLMFRLFQESLSPGKAFFAVTLFAVSFTAIYQSVLYPEPYITFFSVLAIYGVSREDTWGDFLACMAGLLSTLNHEMGILIGVLALRYIRQGRLYMAFTYAVSVLAGWGIFALYLGLKYGHPLAMFQAVKAWHRTWAVPGYNWVMSVKTHPSLDTVLVPVVVILILLHVWHSLRTDRHFLSPSGAILESQEVALWLLFTLLLGLSTFIPESPLRSVTRYLDGAWPVFGFLWFKNERRSLRWMMGLLFLSLFMGTLGAAAYVHGYLYE